jgi:hypothetical protein
MAVGLVLSLAVGTLSYYGSNLVPGAILEIYDVWFTADPPRVYANMTSQYSDHSRTKVHPLYSLLMGVPTMAIRKLARIPSPVAMQIVLSCVAALWTLTLFAILRTLGCRLFDATLFTLLGASSAAAVFWFTVPETYAAGSWTILLAILFAVLAQRASFSPMHYAVVSALTLSITVTNWMVGLLITKARFAWKQTLAISAGALCLVALLWGVQKLIFPVTPFFVPEYGETNYLLASTPGPVLQSFFFHALVMPTIQLKARPKHVSPDAKYVFATQRSRAGSAGVFGILGIALWALLLPLGVWGLWTLPGLDSFRFVLIGTLLGQLTLHLLYGSETFLYSLHYAPLLVIVAACSSLTPARPLALVLGAFATVGFLFNNLRQFQAALDLFVAYLDKL